jgi:hypothetical protein
MAERLYSVFGILSEELAELKVDNAVSKVEISNFQGHFQCLLGLSAQFIQNASTERSMPSNVVIVREDNLSLAASQLSAKCFLVQRVCVLSAENGGGTCKPAEDC